MCIICATTVGSAASATDPQGRYREPTAASSRALDLAECMNLRTNPLLQPQATMGRVGRLRERRTVTGSEPSQAAPCGLREVVPAIGLLA